MTTPPAATVAVSHTTGSLAQLTGAELHGPDSLPIHGLDAIDRAGPGMLTFIRDQRYASRWARSEATAALVSRGVSVPGHDPSRRALLIVPDADLALVRVIEALARPAAAPHPGLHPTAVVDPTAQIDPAASIGPGCVVGPRTRVEAGTALLARVVLGADVHLGRDCTLHPGVVVLDRCTLGRRCILWPGVVIGADGFGYRPGPTGPVKIPHLGTVIIGDDVEIGANSCVDRAKFGATTIGAGTKIDNLVQIGHNCRIGRGCVLCGMVGLAGSVELGDGVVLAGQVGVADNLSIGAGARVGARSGVTRDIPPGQTWLGSPARPARETARIFAALSRFARGRDTLHTPTRAASSSTSSHDAT